jgi:hypothetical protein
MTENPSPETLAETSRTSAADGGGTVESPALTLAELNKQLGSDFKDPSTALRALKDTKDYVGKRKEDIANELRAAVVPQTAPDMATKSDVQALKNQLFYSQNPQYKGYESMINKLGADPAEVVDSPEFKTVFEKVKVADEVAQSKSVVSSNARLSQAKNVMDSAIETANARGSTQEDVALIFARDINARNNA